MIKLRTMKLRELPLAVSSSFSFTSKACSLSSELRSSQSLHPRAKTLEVLRLLIKDSDIFPNTPENAGNSQRHREAARAIVSDGDNKIVLLFVKKYNYHKLPGGGLEKNEDIKTALKREMLEEIGSEIEVDKEIGEIIEFRNEHNLIQTSYIYCAKLKGEKGEPDFTEEEIADGFEIVWLTLDEAIKTLENDRTDNYQGKFVLIRDLTALKAFKEKK